MSDRYDIPKNRHLISEETVRWVCQKLSEGVSRREILETAPYPRLDKSKIADIAQRKTYKHISNEYKF